MTEEHWKLENMSTILRYSFAFLLLLQLEGCHGQDGSNAGGANFFYYYSPTQRTMVNHGAPMTSGNIFSSPFLQQQQVQPTLPPYSPQQQQAALPNLQYSSPATPLLGYQQTHSTPRSIFTTQQPLGQLQFQQFAQQQNLVQPTAAQFPGFTRFGQNLFNAGLAQQSYLQPGAPTFAPQQQQQLQQGGLSFYDSPFQFIQNRYLQTPPTPSVPAPAPEQPLPATTVAPILQQEAVITPSPAPRRKQKLSSRFRYVQAPQPAPIQYEINPYTRLVTPITSAIPYTEQRYYSTGVPTVTSPTGYSFSLGGGTSSTSSVHVNMGPMTNNIQQHLTEITQIHRRVAGKRRKPVVYEDQLAVEQLAQDPVVGAGSMMMSQDTPVMEDTSEQSVIAPSPTPMAMENLTNMTSTMDTLLNEPSFQMEVVASSTPAPATTAPIAEITPNAVEPDASAKISEANIPRRLAIRTKVARRRLRLDGNPEAEVNQGRSVDGAAPVVPTGRRRMGGMRRISQNRLSGDEGKEYDGPQKGLVEESSPVPLMVSTSTTPSPQTPSPAPVESAPEVEENQALMEEQPQVPAMISSTSTTPQSYYIDPTTFVQDEIPESMPVHEVPMANNSPPEKQEPIPSTSATPLTTTPSTTTTLAPVEMKPMVQDESPAPMLGDPPRHYDDYYEEYDDAPLAQPQGPKAANENQQAPALVSETSSDSSSSSESDSAELPILEGAKKEDFPTVFGSQSNDADNSVESEKGQVLMRVKTSQPVGESDEGQDEAVAPPAVPTSSTTTTTTTEESIPEAKFVNNDPPEEHPPSTSEELEEPFFQPLSTTEQPPTMSTTTASSSMLSTTATSPSSSEEEMEDSSEDEREDVPEQQPSSSTTESPVLEEGEPMIVATMSSSTESSPEDAMQPENVGDGQEMQKPLPPSTREMDDNDKTDDLPSSSTTVTPMEASSSTTEEIPMQVEVEPENVNLSTESSLVPFSSTERAEEEMSSDDEQTVSSSTTISPLPSPATTEAPNDSQEDLPQSNENLHETSGEQPDENQSAEKGDKLTSDEVIGQAQRQALGESLRRLRQRQQSTTEPGDDVQQEDENNNGASFSSGESQPKRGFVRKPIQLANLPLPTTPSLPNVNAVLDDGEGEHQSRNQVIEKIQRFRAHHRGRPTTTKRPRRVTRPSSTEKLPLPELDSFSDSSSSTSGPVEHFSTSTHPRSSYSSVITTTQRPSKFRTRTYLTTTTEAITTVEPTTTTTTTTTPATEILTTTNYDQARTTTFPATTTPSTTTTTIDDFIENDDDAKVMTYNEEDDHVYYDEDHHDSTDASSTTVASSSTGRGEIMYTTPSTTTTTSSTEGPFMTTTNPIEPEEFSTDSLTFSTTTTDIPLATTTTAGQLIIHEILPTMPPLKEVSFVIGESVEEDQVIQSEEEEKRPSQPPSHAVVRVVKVSSSVSGEDEPSDSSQQLSDEASNESSPSSTPTSSSLERTGSGRKIRVVIRRQRQRQTRNSVNATSRRMTPNQTRRRRKVIPRQLRRRS